MDAERKAAEAPTMPEVSAAFLFYGAAAIAEDTLRRAAQVFPCGFIQAYALTEGDPITMLGEQDHLAQDRVRRRTCAHRVR